jgi:hypothetical protein
VADNMKVHLDRVHLGIAPPGSKLSFKVKQGSGFIANAMLDCDMKVVASWEFVEIDGGKTLSEKLLPKGTYTLQLSIAYTDKTDTDFVVDFRLSGEGVSEKETLTLTGKRPDIGRALAVVVIR